MLQLRNYKDIYLLILKNMLEIKTLKKEDFNEFKSAIIDFYASKYKFPPTTTTVDNSTIICLAYNDSHIVGAIRAISDLSRHGMIVDLFVDEEFRKNKIGKLLLNSIVNELNKYNVKNVNLSTEPGIDWLADFYKKNGFAEIKDSVHMELEK